MRTVLLVGMAVAVLSISGCGYGPQPLEARGDLRTVSASGVGDEVVGSVAFSERGGEMTITITVSGLTAGEHGIHIHANGDCGPGAASATNSTMVAAGAAGGHFNPDGALHGAHAGDLGNILADAAGEAERTIGADELVADLTLVEDAMYSVVGRSVVVHAARDDGVTDPSGNSGGRVLCGVIELS